MAGRGHYSEVLTTCARDHIAWSNDYPEGAETINGITVRRFPIDRRDQPLQAALQDRINAGKELTRGEEEAWIDSGAQSDRLCAHLREHADDFDFFVFAPYLFGVTYNGLRLVPEKAVLVPCLHDEPYAYLKIIRDLFLSASAVFFNTDAEMALARKIMPLDEGQARVVGMGIAAPAKIAPEEFRARHRIDFPYLLYAGRREGGKSTPLLIEYFRHFRRYQTRDLGLVLMGTGEVGIRREEKSRLLDLGYLAEEDKWNGYAASLAFCQPSTNESFSIVLLESWLAGRPGLVNAFCPVTVDHCLRSNGGIFFRDYYEFEECVLYLLDHPAEANRMGSNGREHVKTNFSWEKVLDRLENGLLTSKERRARNI
jgi:glycosyltransferase involved in cell wall biosynthesis